MKLISPLRVPKTKKKDFILNLNNYRNTHFRSLNATKIRYKQIMFDQIMTLPFIEGPMLLWYKLYPATARLTDVGNVVSVHQKYLEDALVECNRIPEDNYTIILGSIQTFGHIDRINPRVEVEIITDIYQQFQLFNQEKKNGA